MADGKGAWGIEIGQAGLKAIRLRYAEAAEQVVAVAYDYVEHPKILSQPDANEDELIASALEQFLSRNDVRGDKVVISLPNDTALTRFIQLPPVESGKVKDIIKFEARQQIPFALEEVIWDYQTIGAPQEEGGFLLNAEVGLFAMKREQVEGHLQPYLDKKVEVDGIQFGSLALYNFLSFDQMGIRTEEEAVGFDEYTIVMDMGADSTTLTISNGAKIWVRSVRVGGNHFTRALTKEMKLTFARAEHLKKNATRSEDPRAVFQALRPVFNEYVSEVQRSIGFFSSVNREAKITRILGVGNGFKLAGLQKYLQQNLQYDVERVEGFSSCVGDAVLNAGLFQDNIMTFVVPYGLALQGLGLTQIKTSLLPPEIVTARKIRAKKPWATAAAATLLACLGISAAGYANVLNSVSEERFGTVEQAAAGIVDKATQDKAAYDQSLQKHAGVIAKKNEVASPLSPPKYWSEMYKAIAECLPRDSDEVRIQEEASGEQDPRKWNRISVQSITSEAMADVGTWYDDIQQNDASSARNYLADDDKKNRPTGPGYIVTLELVWYRPRKPGEEKGDVGYLRENFLKNLQQWTVPNEAGDGTGDVPVEKMGISHATVITYQYLDPIPYPPQTERSGLNGRPTGRPGSSIPFGSNTFEGDDDDGYTSPVPTGNPSIPADGSESEIRFMLPVTTATVQFVFQPVPEEKRPDERPTEPKLDENGNPVAPATPPAG